MTKQHMIPNVNYDQFITPEIENLIRTVYGKLPPHKILRFINVLKKMDRSDLLDGEIIFPSDNYLPKDFWKN